MCKRTVYPRWRGEHISSAFSTQRCAGLSPLARGTLTDFIDRPIDLRFIPAGAGNTQIPLSLPSLFPVYPRWRGEHGLCALVGENGGGLSPLARGTHFPDRVLRILSRFIPAGAGNTLSIHICF
ncbi:hypothetical protein ECP03022939_2731 [Escherichia coli P0302293.9]|nr:hypothetical protein EC2865200_3090 [Escherichia coli 2865200]EMX14123.1 hypothetical protein ECP03022932_3083 [Escherichia coli P0302293.2]ENB36535.1 hypothetical protein ECMP0215613_2848 [Escherichia coli MP021561.3]ENC60383.1 hypothetical protein ECP02999175_3068 [Escherichia coli P0299917.5]ENC77917.1 hypothetical protein ECP02999177_3090 [Escherichia coli P0299917.7]END97692.1 hypothetical protein ECP03022937_3100 [Escherichia coli P0302293.7]ENE21060.1 hypothetical protein ECP0302293